jgi:type III secretory pathway component EscT
VDAVFAAWAVWLGVQDLPRVAALAALLLARLLPLCLLSPWLLPTGSGWVVALAASTMLSVALLPQALAFVPVALPSGVGFALLFAREVLVGAAFGFLMRLPMEAMTMAGRLADRARNGSPPLEAGPLAAWYRWVALVLFVACGGAELALRAVAEGLSALPLGQALAWSDPRETALAFAQLCSSAIVLGVLLSMPVLLGGLLVDVAHALTQRWLALWPPSLLWLPTRHLVAIALAMVSLSFVASVLPDAYVMSIDQAQAWLDRLTP